MHGCRLSTLQTLGTQGCRLNTLHCASAGPTLIASMAPPTVTIASRTGIVRIPASLLGVGRDLHLEHAVGVGDGAVLRLGALLELVDHLHAGGHLANHGVLAVEERSVPEHDEE